MDLDEIAIKDRISEIYELINFGYPTNTLISILKYELDYLITVLEQGQVMEAMDND